GPRPGGVRAAVPGRPVGRVRPRARGRRGRDGMKAVQLRNHEKDLGFVPQESVRWLSPAQLVDTAVKVGLSSIFASYSDKREIQASLACELIDRSAGDELWIDFVADPGDGFDATYTVARLVAQDDLTAGGTVLPRGSLLVFGGDEVYPTASIQGYEDRLKGPYRSALPGGAEPAPDDPTMVALPGNHDWYDGLTAFLRT